MEETEEVARIAPLAFAKRRVLARFEMAKDEVVALLVVAFSAVKLAKVDEPVARRLPKKPVPETESAVEEAYGKTEAVVDVAVKDDAVTTPCTFKAPRRSELPATSKMLPVVVVAEAPSRKTYPVLEG